MKQLTTLNSWYTKLVPKIFLCIKLIFKLNASKLLNYEIENGNTGV